ncbi:TetR family transcriptional regulator C-terminal domain-containing protein [Kitasatospora purpeofusca]|uniref:TetR family transcriptional regulator C-terminal domain-containing protein n=1 Tax=Kitasatospora purpeofusca TaxID=67352 RepID=UPI00364A7F43
MPRDGRESSPCGGVPGRPSVTARGGGAGRWGRGPGQGDDLRRIAIQAWGEALRRPEPAERTRSFYLDVRGSLAELAGRWREEGRLGPQADPEAVASALMSLMPGLLVGRYLVDPVPVDRMVEGLSALASASPPEQGGSGLQQFRGTFNSRVGSGSSVRRSCSWPSGRRHSSVRTIISRREVGGFLYWNARYAGGTASCFRALQAFRPVRPGSRRNWSIWWSSARIPLLAPRDNPRSRRRNARTPENQRAPRLASRGGKNGKRNSFCDCPSDAGNVQSTVPGTDASFDASSQVSGPDRGP